MSDLEKLRNEYREDRERGWYTPIDNGDAYIAALEQRIEDLESFMVYQEQDARIVALKAALAERDRTIAMMRAGHLNQTSGYGGTARAKE